MCTCTRFTCRLSCCTQITWKFIALCQRVCFTTFMFHLLTVLIPFWIFSFYNSNKCNRKWLEHLSFSVTRFMFSAFFAHTSDIFSTERCSQVIIDDFGEQAFEDWKMIMSYQFSTRIFQAEINSWEYFISSPH